MLSFGERAETSNFCTLFRKRFTLNGNTRSYNGQYEQTEGDYKIRILQRSGHCLALKYSEKYEIKRFEIVQTECMKTMKLIWIRIKEYKLVIHVPCMLFRFWCFPFAFSTQRVFSAPFAMLKKFFRTQLVVPIWQISLRSVHPVGVIG